MNLDIDEQITAFEHVLRSRNIQNVVVQSVIAVTYVVSGMLAGSTTDRVPAFLVAAAAVGAAALLWTLGKSRLDPNVISTRRVHALRDELLRQEALLRMFTLIVAPLIAALAYHAYQFGSILSTVMLIVIFMGQITNRQLSRKFKEQAKAL